MTQGTWYSGRSSMLSSEISANEATQTRCIAVRCSSATSKPVIGSGGLSSSRFDEDVPEVNSHMNSVVLVESQGSCALVRIVRVQKFDRRDNMIFTVHLNRLIDEKHTIGAVHDRNLPTSTRKLRKFPVTSGQGSKHRDWTASR